MKKLLVRIMVDKKFINLCIIYFFSNISYSKIIISDLLKIPKRRLQDFTKIGDSLETKLPIGFNLLTISVSNKT